MQEKRATWAGGVCASHRRWCNALWVVHPSRCWCNMEAWPVTIRLARLMWAHERAGTRGTRAPAALVSVATSLVPRTLAGAMSAGASALPNAALLQRALIRCRAIALSRTSGRLPASGSSNQLPFQTICSLAGGFARLKSYCCSLWWFDAAKTVARGSYAATVLKHHAKRTAGQWACRNLTRAILPKI